ncbi:MAG: RHS repeat-associated core domain-containing protein [Anaeroplasmataceae bacterium]
MYDVEGIIGARVSSNGTITNYTYVKDFYNNVIAVLKGSSVVAKYIYDAWGNIIYEYKDSTDIFAPINPIRYRSYYYDLETKLYYLESRYYNPEMYRFISPDSVDYLDYEIIGGLDLYAYCNNNPVMYYDPMGHSAILAMLIGASIGAIIGLGSQVTSDVISNFKANKFDFSKWEMSSWQTYVGAGLGGAIGGALTPFFGPVSTAFITGFSSTAISMGLSNATGASNFSFEEVFITSLLIGSISGVTAGILDNIKIPGITSGRGSLSSIQKQINTKFVRNRISGISIKTFGKMLALEFFNSLPSNFLNSFTNGIVLTPITNSY